MFGGKYKDERKECSGSINRTITVIDELADYLGQTLKTGAPTKEIISLIEFYNDENSVLDLDKTIFSDEYEKIITYEIQRTYESITLETEFKTVVQVCDCHNLMENLWSAIILVDDIIHRFDADDSKRYFYYQDFKYFIFLKLIDEKDLKILNSLTKLTKCCKLEQHIEFIPLLHTDDFDNELYDLRLANRLQKIDLLLLLDHSDVTNLINLKVVETLGLIQPRSFILSISQSLVYSTYVCYSPSEKFALLKKSSTRDKRNKFPGRWNLVYDTKRLENHANLESVNLEMTRCVEYLDG